MNLNNPFFETDCDSLWKKTTSSSFEYSIKINKLCESYLKIQSKKNKSKQILKYFILFQNKLEKYKVK